MEKVLRLYKYIDGINDIAFPNEKEQAIITSFRYDAKRMGAAPTISFSLMHSLCLDSLWDNKVYASFNGERFYIKQTPTSSYSSSDTRYKHDVELVSERFILDNIYFYDVVSSSSQDKPVSNSSKFSFFGNIEEYVSRLNNSLSKSNVGYSIVIDDDILSDEALKSIESQVTFEDQVITNVLQEIYNVYKIPYYFVGKTIHVGYYQDNIDTVFKYGCKDSLISISKTNANSKIINKITGVGSSDNIPYYYPNVDEKGITQVLCNGLEGRAEITDLVKYRKVKLSDKFVFHETIQSLVPLIDEYDYSFGDFRDEGIDGDGKQRVSIDFYYSFTLQQYESVEFSVTTTYEDSLDLRYEIFNPSGQYVAYYKEDKRLNLTGGNYQFVIRWSFLSKEPMIGSDDVIKNFVSQYLKVKANIVVDSSNAWTKNNIPVTLSDYGISVNSPSNGDVLTIERLAYIQPQPNLVPPIYRDTEGGERFYEAINGKYKNEQGGYYQFDNEYTPTNPREHIENFDDIKPTIKNVINGSGDYIDEFIDFAYDLNDNDETDESGKFIHPYFFGKLRKFDGEFGFNLFDHAIDEGEMVVSMTSGTCGSCEFVIGVDEQSQKNIVQVDSDGNLVRDNNGNVRRTGTPQDRQNDTKNNEVWIALKKDIQTFGVVMPNAGNNYRPKAGDKFVLLHIDLPQQYVEAAENALKDKLIKYMHENNFEKFNFSIAFSRIYFAENPTILANLSENSKIKIEYNNNICDLYISSLSYSISNDSALPEVKVELEDALSISQNQITQVVESTKREIISSIDKNVFWGDIKGVPTWITNDKPRYSYSELSGRGTSDNSNDVWVVKKDEKGNSYVYTKLDVVVERGVTMYGTDGSVNLPSIYDGLPLDNDTIYWEETKDEEGNVIARVLKSRGVGEGGVTPTLLGDLKNVGEWANAIATEDRIMVQKKGSSSWESFLLSEIKGSASFENVKESGEGNAFTSFTLSEDKKTLTFVKDKTFAEKSNTLSGYGITDTYTKTEANNLLAKKWTQDNNKISNWDAAFGWGDHSKANYATKSSTLSGYGITDAYTKTGINSLLEDKADWGTTLGDYGITDAYTSEAVDELLSGYLPLEEGGTIAGDLRLQKNGEWTSTYLYFGDNKEVYLVEESDQELTIHANKRVILGSPVTYIDGDLVVKGGVTMFANEGEYTPSTITQAVNVDGITIVNDGTKIMLNPNLELGGGLDEEKLETYLNQNQYAKKSDIDTRISNIVNGAPEAYDTLKEIADVLDKNVDSVGDIINTLGSKADKSTTISGYGITDAYTKNNVDSLLSAKWTQNDAKISNWDTAYSWGNHAQAGYFKSADFTKDKIKATLGLSDWALASTKPSYTTKEVAEDTNLYFTNARAVSALAETLKGYVTLSGTQTITGEKNFTDGLKVNGSPIVYNATGKYWKLEGDLLVTGGITMFGNDSSFNPSTITQAVNIDGSTLVRKNGVIMLNPDIQLGGGSDIDLSEYAKKATTLAGYGITDAYTKTDADNKYLLKTSYTASDVLAKLKTVDGANSGLDADKLDGQEGSYYASAASLANYLPLVGGPMTGDIRLINGTSSVPAIRWELGARVSSDLSGNLFMISPSSIAMGAGYTGAGSSIHFQIASTGATGIAKSLLVGHDGYLTSDLYSLVVYGDSWYEKSLIVGENVRPRIANTTNVGTSDYLLANVYTKKATIDGIEIKKSASGVLYIDGNLVVSGGVTMYGTDGTTTNTIWDSAPIASTSIKGIASFDSNYFAVNNGKVTFIGQTGGGGVTDYNDLTGKPDLSVYALKTSLSSYATKGSTLSHYGISNAYTKAECDNMFLTKTSYTAADVLSKIKTVDGSGSGVDADLLDGVDNGDLTAKYFSPLTLTSVDSLDDLNDGVYSYINANNPSSSKGNNAVLMQLSGRWYDRHQIVFEGNGENKLWHRNSNYKSIDSVKWTKWREIAHTDSDITGNAATATALKTPITLWGNSFDGSANVSGDIGLMTRKIFWHGDTNNYSISCPTTASGAELVYKAYSSHRFFSGLAERFTILSSGYVGIGATNPQSKLQVDQSGWTNGITINRTVSGGGSAIAVHSNGTHVGNFGISGSKQFEFSVMSGASEQVKMSVDSSGNGLFYGGVTMYSDLRKKTILNHVELSLKEVADAPLIEHYYNSDESKRTHVGSVAQYWAGLNDWFCKEDEEGFLTMEIQNAALASAISVARELTRYESKTDKQIKKLKKRIGELEEEIENLKKV